MPSYFTSLWNIWKHFWNENKWTFVTELCSILLSFQENSRHRMDMGATSHTTDCSCIVLFFHRHPQREVMLMDAINFSSTKWPLISWTYGILIWSAAINGCELCLRNWNGFCRFIIIAKDEALLGLAEICEEYAKESYDILWVLIPSQFHNFEFSIYSNKTAWSVSRGWTEASQNIRTTVLEYNSRITLVEILKLKTEIVHWRIIWKINHFFMCWKLFNSTFLVLIQNPFSRNW